MSDKIIEGSQDPKDELIPDEETRKTLEEMKAEGKSVPALEAEKPAEEKVEEPAETEEENEEEAEEKTTEEKKEETEEKPEKVNRPPTMMPTFKHKIAEKSWTKRETELLGKIETLKNKPTETPAQEAKATEDMDAKIAKLAEEKGVDAELIKSIVGLVPTQETPAELKEALEALNELKATNATAKAENDFSKEFDSVKPLIEAEYPKISEGDLAKIKQQLKDNAFTEEYKTTPLSVIYKGVDGFREAVMSKKKSAESSRSGQNRNSEIQDYTNWTEDDIKSASREEASKYFEWVDKNLAG